MSMSLLAITPEASASDLDFGTRLALATEVLIRGILTVFAVLAIIWVFLTLIRLFFYDLPNKRKQTAPAVAPRTSEMIAPAVTATALPQRGDEELVAVIAAAIAAASGQGTEDFRVVAFKRIHK